MVAAMTGSPKEDRPLSRHTARDTQGDSHRRNAFKAAMREKSVKSQRDAQHGQRIETAAKRQIEPSDAAPPQQHHRRDESDERSNDGNHSDPTFKPLVRMCLLYRASINDEANLVPSLNNADCDTWNTKCIQARSGSAQPHRAELRPPTPDNVKSSKPLHRFVLPNLHTRPVLSKSRK
jgi:hypothetical protein